MGLIYERDEKANVPQNEEEGKRRITSADFGFG